MDTLDVHLSTRSNTLPITGKEMNLREDMLKHLSSKVNQMAATFNMSSFNNSDCLLGPNLKQDDIMNRTIGLEKHGLVGFQRKIIKEPEEDFEKLEETVTNSKHIALAVNEELSLHTRLLVGMWTPRISTYRAGFYPVEGSELEPFVVGSLIQKLCRVTKFGWLDDDRFKEVIKEAKNFLCQCISYFSISLPHSSFGRKGIAGHSKALNNLWWINLNISIQEMRLDLMKEMKVDFTLESLHSCGVYYLFGLCSRLVTSVQFLKTDTTNLLDEYAPKIVEGFNHFFKIWFFAVALRKKDSQEVDGLALH
nr:syntaxin-51 [Quercus suber]